jgi:hypothetical protein
LERVHCLRLWKVELVTRLLLRAWLGAFQQERISLACLTAVHTGDSTAVHTNTNSSNLRVDTLLAWLLQVSYVLDTEDVMYRLQRPAGSAARRKEAENSRTAETKRDQRWRRWFEQRSATIKQLQEEAAAAAQKAQAAATAAAAAAAAEPEEQPAAAEEEAGDVAAVAAAAPPAPAAAEAVAAAPVQEDAMQIDGPAV